VWGDVSAFELAASLKAHSYLSHSTAVYLHGLTDQIPQTLYVNTEQSPKPTPEGTLTQASLDRAFRGRQRSSKYVFIYKQNRLVMLSGKHTGRYGVIDRPLPDGVIAPVTDLERTLVDITVRPVYGGGVHQVLAAFRSAAAQVSLTKLLATLKRLNYVYPYHQALGFYLERTGVSAARLKPLRQLGLDYDFYLAHGMKDSVLDSSWRVFHPKRL
jgi:predicted transcriptional regulator of viral defense system